MDFVLSLLGAMPGAVAQGFIYGIFALGVYITYKILDVADLTVDGSIVTGGAVATLCILSGVNPLIAVFVAFLAGLVAGAITGFFHVSLGIPAILAGILTQLSLYSINMGLMGSSNLKVSISKYNLIVTLRNNNHTILVGAIFVVALIALLYWFFGTEFGCSIRATGANRNMSRAQGINTNMTTVFGLMLSNGLVALAGGIYAQYQGNADINMGRGAIVIGLASVIIGDVLCNAIFKKGANFMVRMAFIVLGSVIYYAVIALVIQVGLPTDYLKLLSALTVAVFLAVPYLKGKYGQKRPKKKGVQTNA